MATDIATQNETKKPLTIRQQLESDAFRQSIAQMLPKHVSAERMARVAIAALARTPQLRNCDQASFFRCMMDLSQWGLEPDGRRAHLIPFNNRKLGIIECQLIIDYKGLVELVLRSGTVSNIHADVVCDNDDFEYDRGELKRHKIDFRNSRGKVYAAYCLVRMKDGTEKCEVMTRDEIEAVRRRSKAGSNGPWVTDWNEMAKKTAFRRVSKWLPLSAEVQSAFHGDDDVIDVSAPVIAPSRNLDDLADRLMGGSIEAETEDGRGFTIEQDDSHGEASDEVQQEQQPDSDVIDPIDEEIQALAQLAIGHGCPADEAESYARRSMDHEQPPAWLGQRPWAKRKGKTKQQSIV